MRSTLRANMPSRAAAQASADSLWQRWRFFPRLLGLIWALNRRDMLLLASFSLAGGLLPILTLSITLQLVDRSIAVIAGRLPLEAVIWWLLGFFFLGLLENLFAIAHEQFKDTMLDRVRLRAHEQLLSKISRRSLVAFERPDQYDQFHRAQQGLDQRFWETMTALIPMPLHLVTVVAMLLYVASAHLLFPLMLLVGVLPVVWIRWREDRQRYHLDRSHTAATRTQEYLETVMLERPAAAEIRLFGLQRYFFERWRALFQQLREERLQRAHAEMKALVLPVIGEQLMYGAVIVGVVLLVALGRMTVGALVAYLGAVERFLNANFALLIGVTTIDTDLRYLRDLLEYLDLEEGPTASAPLLTTNGALADQPTACDISAAPAIVGGRGIPGISFENVTFSYPGSSSAALEEITFTVAPGERIALVGINGAGKSTLVKLLLGLYQPSKGRILVDGCDLRQIDPQNWRSRIAAVFQEYVKYELTARENIGFGDLQRLEDMAAIGSAAARSGADAVVAELPAGYETPLGKTYYVDGQDLSIGQWQKLAIARAYVRDAAVLVLDEPTAALDAKAEAAVYERFRDMAQGRSVLLISHRLGSARLADRLLVLDKGRIVEQGRHRELLAKGGLYAELYSIQAEWYR
jgi:ATP-binding cassette, subfamily B, bacterial